MEGSWVRFMEDVVMEEENNISGKNKGIIKMGRMGVWGIIVRKNNVEKGPG